MAGEQRANYHDRVRRAQAEMARQGVDALAIGVGADLIYLAGYPSHTSERLTLMIVPKEGEPKIVVPQLEAPRLGPAGVPFEPVAWEETADPTSIAADIIWETGARSVASGDELWASFLIKMQRHLPEVKWEIAGDIMRELRMCKDAAEVALIREASHRTDEAWVEFTQTKIAGLTERQAARATDGADARARHGVRRLLHLRLRPEQRQPALQYRGSRHPARATRSSSTSAGATSTTSRTSRAPSTSASRRTSTARSTLSSSGERGGLRGGAARRRLPGD